MLEKLAMMHLVLPVGNIGQIFDEVAEAVAATRGMIVEHAVDQQGFRNVGDQMLAAWDAGVSELAGKQP